MQGTSHHVIVFLLRQAATERAAMAPEAASRGGVDVAISYPLRVGKGMAFPVHVHFIGFIVVFFGNLSFRLRLQKLSFCWQGHGYGAFSHFNHFATCDFAGCRSHRNLQWFLRTGPHAQGLKKGSGGIPATYPSYRLWAYPRCNLVELWLQNQP